MPDNTGAVDLSAGPAPALEDLPPEEQEAVERLAFENPPQEGERQQVPVATAFVVLVTRTGETQVAAIGVAETLALDNPEPTEDQVYGAVSVVAKDMIVGATARTTVEFQMQQARAMAEQAQAAAIAQGIDLSKLRA